MATPFFAQLLQRRLKNKKWRTGNGGAEAINGFTKIAKGVQKKVAGSWLGGGSYMMRIWVRSFLVAVGG